MRECFSTSILLGSLDRPLKPGPTCEPQDISEDGQSVFACLCETDYCNAYRSPGEPLPDPTSLLTSKQSELKPTRSSNNSLVKQADEDVTSMQQERTPVKTVPQENIASSLTTTTSTTSLPAGPLRCHSCGDLFNPDTVCDMKEMTDDIDESLETCDEEEVCLLYMWHKSATYTAAVRHCFPTRILLGND